MHRSVRYSIIAILAVLSLGVALSASLLTIPAFARGGDGATQDRPTVRVVEDSDREVLPAPRGDREALIQTDRSYYEAGEVIVATGSGFDVGEVVTLVLHEEPTVHKDRKVTVVADSFGNIFDNQFVREGSEKGITLYLIARGETSGLTTQATMANPSADLDQWANLPTASWVNGNLGASKAFYREGDSIPYRLRFGNLTLAPHTVTIEWDTTKSSKHALDYLTTFDRSFPPLANPPTPCTGVSGCGSASTYAIPVDPQVSGSSVTPVAGLFTIYGGTVSSVSAYSYSNGSGFVGDKSARISITFTPTQANPVIAWGGHISTRLDWGVSNSAVTIPGSPYHTRLVELDGGGGNQDRSLSADAVVFPGSITIIKDAVPNSAQDFAFTATGGLATPFSLDDDSDPALSNTKQYPGVTTFTSYSVSETAVTGWTLSFNTPACTVTSPNGGSASSSSTGVTINMKEGENYTCTFVNTRQAAKLTVTKVVTGNTGGNKQAGDFPLFVDSTQVTSGVQNTFDIGAHVVSETQQTGYSLVSITGDCDANGNVSLNPGDTKSCTITNTPVAPRLTVTKVITNNTNGTKQVSDFPLFVDATGVTSGAQNTFSLGAHVVSETQQTGYSLVSITGDCASNGNITLNPGDVKACTITNTPIGPKLTVTKVITNNTNGTKQVSEFPLLVDATGVTSGAQNTFSVGAHVVSETQQTGYTQVSITGDCASNGNITLNPGDVKACTITNTPIAPKLTVIKVVHNNHGGGKAVSDFPLFVDTTGVTSGVQNTFGLGAHVVSETPQTGYTQDSITGDCDANGNVTLNPGDVKSCTITNSDSKNTPNLATTMKWVLKDDVTVSGLRAGASDASSAYVIFTLFGPFGPSDVASCDGAPIFTSLQADGALTYDQSGTSGTASTGGFEVSGPGTYLWRAHYSGDQNNNARDTDCGSEKTEVKDLSPSS